MNTNPDEKQLNLELSRRYFEKHERVAAREYFRRPSGKPAVKWHGVLLAEQFDDDHAFAWEAFVLRDGSFIISFGEPEFQKVRHARSYDDVWSMATSGAMYGSLGDFLEHAGTMLGDTAFFAVPLGIR